MDKDTASYKQYGLVLPPDVRARFDGEIFGPARDKLADEHSKTRVVYSYGSIAATVWSFLSKKLDLKTLCPPIVIDWRNDADLPVVYNDQGVKYAWINGIFNHTSIIHNEGNDQIAVIPLDYECRIFHANVMTELTSIFGSHPLELGLILVITHTLIHEICHYVHLLWKYQQAIDDVSQQKLLDYVQTSSSPQNEYENEKLTIQLLMDFHLTGPYGLRDLGSIVIDGPYDRWKREIDPYYALVSYYLQARLIENEASIDNATDEMLDTLDQCYGMLTKITKTFREEARPFGMVD